MAIEVTVFELDPRATRLLGDEANLDLACLLVIRLDLPLQ